MPRIPTTVSGDDRLRKSVQSLTSPTNTFTVAGVAASNALADRYTLDSTANLLQTQQFLATVCRVLIERGIITGEVTV